MPQAEKVISIKHVYKIRPRKDKRGVDLISDALPFGRLWSRTRLRLDSLSAQGCADSNSKNAQTQVSASRCACS
jgi:hypothetical protein